MINELKDIAPEVEGTRSIKREQKVSSDSKEKSEKLDLRKLIIYSEIMKPKFD